MNNVAGTFKKIYNRNEQPLNTQSHHIVSVSGAEPQTHPSLLNDSTVSSRKLPLTRSDTYTCKAAVDMPKLLRATRSSLLSTAESIGANTLVDELWRYKICGPKPKQSRMYKVQIQYSACATRSQRGDPHKPVALDKAKSVPGLMTILGREGS